METIFDHNVTKEELRKLFGDPDFEPEICLECNQENNYIHIYRLYLLRGNKQKWVEYLNKIPDSENKLFSIANHDHAVMNVK
ncbi:MAG: hypothetical protein LUD17_09015 [Bacteroidales bacterium]|nr:hypothetical protein [Bacteroidales bacterium]